MGHNGKINLILCEGETDRDLLGYYLIRVSGWQWKRLKEPPFSEQCIGWYQRGSDDIMGIWPVGGDDFTAAIMKVMKRENMEHSVGKLVIVTDHDDEDAEKSRLEKIRGAILKNLQNAYFGEENTSDWLKIVFNNSFGQFSMDFCYVLVPYNEMGALETFMLNALSEKDEGRKDVIVRAKKFVEDLSSDSRIGENYLKARRDRIKAGLGVSVAIFSPDRVFTTMNELIESVSWENFDASHQQFQILKEI